jgi:hypothetical protein
MQKSRTPQAKSGDSREAIESPLDSLGDWAAEYWKLTAIWSDATRFPERPRGSLFQAVSQLLFGSYHASMPRKREGILTNVRMGGHLGRVTIPFEVYREVCRDIIREAVKASEVHASLDLPDFSYFQPLSKVYENLAKFPEVLIEEERTEPLKTWPDYPVGDFRNLVERAGELQDSIEDASRMLYLIMEMEVLLSHIEERARATGRKYEARLAASLRDLCRVHDPSDFSQEQTQCLKACVTALVEGWGKITREKLNYVRTRLMEKGLTWLPVTDKAAADIEEAKTQHSA